MLAILPALLLFLLVYDLPHFPSAYPKWTYHQAVGKAVFATWWRYASVVEYRPIKTLEPGADGARVIVVQPTSTDIYRGILATDPAVCPVPIGGSWYPRSYNPDVDAGKKIAIHFHGGAYYDVLGRFRPMESDWAPDILARQLSSLVLQLQCWQAMNAGSRFPAAIQGWLTADADLLAQGVAHRQYCVLRRVCWRQPGGAMLRFLAEHEAALLRLRAAMLWSLRLDLIMCQKHSKLTPTRLQIIFPVSSFNGAVTMSVLASLGAEHAYISPLRNE